MVKSLFLIAALLSAAPALAQDAEEPAICTDRPTKANSTCSVPSGKLQLEADLFNWTRIEAGGTKTDIYLYTSPTLKLGLDDRSDLQVNWTPYAKIDTEGAGSVKGVGDVLVRYKRRLTADEAPVSVAVIPFVKIPTGKRGISNREFEGGIAVPIQIPLKAGPTLTFGPELDILADADGSGHHVQIINVANLSGSLGGKWSLAGEFWMANNFDPADTVTQVSADAALIYAASNTLQLDLGANFGLNSNTPDVQLYLGLSTRF